MLNQVEFVLTKRGFGTILEVNIHGTEGRNNPCDLHMEHVNRLCKDALYGLQANKTPAAIYSACGKISWTSFSVS